MPQATILALMAWIHTLLRQRPNRSSLPLLLTTSSSLPPAPPPPPTTTTKEKTVIRLPLRGATYSWVVSMAREHTYGSSHKAIRDLLDWAFDNSEDDHTWLFTNPHPLLPFKCDGETHEVRARLDAHTARWIGRCVTAYQLEGPGHLVDVLSRAAVALDAENDVFASVEAGLSLPTRSADLYYDLGIFSKPPPVPANVA